LPSRRRGARHRGADEQAGQDSHPRRDRDTEPALTPQGVEEPDEWAFTETGWGQRGRELVLSGTHRAPPRSGSHEARSISCLMLATVDDGRVATEHHVLRGYVSFGGPGMSSGLAVPLALVQRLPGRADGGSGVGGGGGSLVAGGFVVGGDGDNRVGVGGEWNV